MQGLTENGKDLAGCQAPSKENILISTSQGKGGGCLSHMKQDKVEIPAAHILGESSGSKFVA